MPFRPTLVSIALTAFGLLWAQPTVQAQGTKQRSLRMGEMALSLASEPSPPAPVASLLSGQGQPLRQREVSLKQLGVPKPIALRGVDSDSAVGVSVRVDEMVVAAKLRLTFTLSPALLPGLSHLKISLNDEVLHTVLAEKGKLGVPQTVELPLDPRYFTDYNQLRFQLIGHYTVDCESPHHSSLWASISDESQLVLTLQPVALRNDLAQLPLPFFDPRDNQTVKVPFVLGANPNRELLKAAGSVAAWLGMLASYRGGHFPALANALPDGHGIVLATNQHRPDFLRDLPPVQKPTLTLIDHPVRAGKKLLLVLGQDEAQVQTAADVLALDRSGLSGASMQVAEFKHPDPRKPYDAPRWITTKRPVQLAELVNTPDQLELRGPVLNGVVNVNMRTPPDLFTWYAPAVPLNLSYRYSAHKFSDRGTLNISINNRFVKSIPLQSKDADNKDSRNLVDLPLLGEGALQVTSGLRIPSFLIVSDNQLQFDFDIPPPDMGRCSSAKPPEMRAVLDPQSTIDLTGFSHYAEMPNLATYGFSGFPFTKYADLAQTSIVLPEVPTPADISLYLAAVGRMAASTGYPGTRFQLLGSRQIGQAGDTDILVITQGDADGVLRQWGQHLPALVAAGQRSLRPLARALDSLSDWFSLQPVVRHTSTGGQTVLEGEGPLGAIVGFASPLREGRSVVALTGTDDAAMQTIADSLNRSGKVRNLRGDLAFLRGEAIESFRVNPVYYVGELTLWRRLWFEMHSHPVLLAFIGLGSGLMLALMAFVGLRATARRRLEVRNDD